MKSYRRSRASERTPTAQQKAAREDVGARIRTPRLADIVAVRGVIGPAGRVGLGRVPFRRKAEFHPTGLIVCACNVPGDKH